MSETYHRIFVEWDHPDGGYLTSLDSDFHEAMQEFVERCGPPTRVEFRDSGEGWHTSVGVTSRAPSYIDPFEFPTD